MSFSPRLLALLACFGLAGTAFGQDANVPNTGMLRYPDVSQKHIVFLFANDLWLVDRAGGMARPLASPPGIEAMPRFNADGSRIAFVGSYDGGRDIYSIGVDGGIPQRHTWHPATEAFYDWSPQGGFLYSSNGFAGLSRAPQLYHLAPDSPQAVRLPVPYGTNGTMSADGEWLAYTPFSRDTRTWKRYRGGMASDVWLFNLKTKKSRRVTDWEGTDSLPMWNGNTLFYLSDAGDEHRLNIWAFDVASGKHRQVTKFADYDCKWPAIGPGADGKGEIVLQNGADLYLLNCASGESHVVKVTIPGARPRLRPQQVDASKFITGGDLSPSGKRVALEARGDIWTAPVKNGMPRNLTRTSGVAERSPSWSPDGQWIAYLADKTGEYELFMIRSDGRGEPRQLTDNGRAFRYDPVWSPDSKRLTFTDKTGALWLHTIESEETRLVDTDPWASQLNVSWSHDSAWIAYSRSLDARVGKTAIFVYDVATNQSHQLTSGYFNDNAPAFDRKGQFLYFSSNRAFNSPKYEDIGTTFIYSDTAVMVALPLRADVELPLKPKSDEEPIKAAGAKSPADSKEDGKGDDESAKGKADAAASGEKKPAEPIRIDVDDAEQRVFQLPVPQGGFGTVAVNDKGQILYARRGSRGGRGGRGGRGSSSSIQLLDLTEDSPSEKTVLEGAGGFGISADGKKLIVGQGGKFFVVAAAAGQKLSSPVSTDGMMATVDPRAEWLQIFTDAWRIERDFFYDPNMHGVDWHGVRQRYAAMLDDCVSREDVGFVIGEMIAEINVGHAYYRPGAGEETPRSTVGVLGCEFEFDGAWKVGRLFEGAAWDVDARNPLRMAGIQSGEYIVAVNGTPVDNTRSIFAALDNTAGRTVPLTVSKDKEFGGDDDRDVVVKPLSSDYNLRFRAWIEANRRYVAEKTNGQVGYIYVTSTGVGGQNDLVRHFYGEINKPAVIVDERWNSGGQIPTRFVELLNRPVTNYWARRDGRDMTWPPDSHQGPKCMLINGMSGSGGDMFPALFRQMKVGKLIGRRTWGGLVGISGNPGMIDGSGVTAPTFAYYEKDGTWGIEGHGVDPDIEVMDDPALMTDGGDPQLDAAIQHMLDELKRSPYVPPKRPPYPNRRGLGIKDTDK